MPFKPRAGYSRFKNDGAGAREGLRQKMEYWANKDFNYEYGVSLGQAINLAIDSGADVSSKEFDEMVLKIFSKNLALKNDKRFREAFRTFFDNRANINAMDFEKSEKAMDAAENTVSDFGPAADEHNNQLL